MKNGAAAVVDTRVSGHTGAPLDRVAREAGAMALIRKPFTGDELTERLRLVRGATR